MQWHLTNRCNKRCSHCYQEGYQNKEFTTEELLSIGNQYLELLDTYNRLYNINCKGHINITGGEPFLHMDRIYDLLDNLIQYYPYFSEMYSSTNFSYPTWTD